MPVSRNERASSLREPAVLHYARGYDVRSMPREAAQAFRANMKKF
jgi:hypothetical protein